MAAADRRGGGLAVLLVLPIVIWRAICVPDMSLAGVPRCAYAEPAPDHARQIRAARRQLAVMMRRQLEAGGQFVRKLLHCNELTGA